MSDDRCYFGSPSFDDALAARFDDQVQRVVRLAAQLCTVPGVTVPCSRADFDALSRTVLIAREYAERRGLRVIERPATTETPYPFLLVTFGDCDLAAPAFREAVALVGHLDVVPAQKAEQFSPYLEGSDLFARGSADMKTVVASYLVWLGDLQQRPGPKPPIVLLLSCCEENGSDQSHDAASVLAWLEEKHGIDVRFAVIGERTGELEWMEPEPPVGVICRENRSWRWIRVESPGDRGLPALDRVARTIRAGRTAIHELNEKHTPAAKMRHQPGVRSGFVNSFAFVPGAAPASSASDAGWLLVERPAGASIHSATAQAAQESLVERFAALAAQAVEVFGAERVHLAGVEIGQDGNFNSYDGSGSMKLCIEGAELAAWAAGVDQPDLRLVTSDAPLQITTGPTVIGIDIRELLDHRSGVQRLVDELGTHLDDGATVDLFNDLPPWRCPGDHPDLLQLEAAYREVVGQPSPDLVKLHGNDGGHLAARQQASDETMRERGLGHAVVFGQVGKYPHGAQEFHRVTSIRPYLDILDRWVEKMLGHLES